MSNFTRGMFHFQAYLPPGRCAWLRNPGYWLFFIPVWTLIFSAGCRNQPAPRPTRFSLLRHAETGLHFENTLPEQTPDSMNIIQYLYYYNGGGVAAGDVNNDGLPDLYFSANTGPNRLYLNRGSFNFEDVTDPAGVGGTGSWKTGVTMADVDGDGWLDIYVCQVGKYKKFNGRNQLFINNRDGTFSERARDFGLDLQAFATQAAFFDFDRDGDLDCFIVCHSVHAAGNYRDTSLTRRADPLAADRLYRNNGAGKFEDVSLQYGIYGGPAGYGLGLAIGDLNGDGWPDIYVGNDFHENDYLYYNRAGQRFDEAAARSFGHTSNFSMGCDLADFNNDGRTDVVTLDMRPEDERIYKASQPVDAYDIYQFKHSLGYHWQLPHNCLQLNRGAGHSQANEAVFSEIAELAGIAATDWSWSAFFADLDLDGWKDLYITNGIARRPNDLDYLKFISSKEVQQNAPDTRLIEQMPPGAAKNYAFRNQGDLTFADSSAAWGLDTENLANGAAYADLDGDGDLDLVTNNLNAPASVYRNNGQGYNYLKIRLAGLSPNHFGIGARIWARGSNGTQYFENQTVRGFQSSVEPVLTIGLGQDSALASLTVEWPDGRRQSLQNIRANQTLTLGQAAVTAGAAESGFAAENAGALAPPAPIFFPHIHRENSFEDNTREKLIPWFLSTPGPRLAIGDFNRDDLDDVYISGRPGALFFQTKFGGFAADPLATPLPEEETAVAAFDADGDGDTDLWLSYGSYEKPAPGDTTYNFLLLNDGNGHFSVAGRYPGAGGRRIVPGDFDADGDLDVFLAGHAVPGRYGMAARSALLVNQGGGNFEDRTDALAPGLALAGMLTDAVWADLDRDGRPDLVTCGEWAPVSVWRNTGSGFTRQDIEHSTGLWNTLRAADLDGDGDTDLLGGNLGLNSILRASAAEPLGLWLADFDDNGTPDPILTYYRQGKNYVWADKDLLVSQLPSLRKQFVQYAKYAGSPFETVFSKEKRRQAAFLSAEQLSSCYFEYRGAEGWRLHPLPNEAQLSPVFAVLIDDFSADGQPDILLGGNFFEVQPAIGRLDASFGALLLGNREKGFTPIEPGASGWWLPGPVRDLQWLRARNGDRILVVGINNGEVMAYRVEAGKRAN